MSEEKNKPTIVKQVVTPDAMNPTKVSVSFIVHSHDAREARDYVASDLLIEEGVNLCAKQPLMQVGISSRGVPFYCDVDGKPLDLTFIDKPEEGAPPADHYYCVTHEYNGLR